MPSNAVVPPSQARQVLRATPVPEAIEGIGVTWMHMFVRSYGNCLPHSRQAT